ncbi:MAG: STAS domain-containing protein [Gaiellaceae bacterium]
MAPAAPNTIVFAVVGALARADLPTQCERVRNLVETTGAEIVLCDLSRLEVTDAVAVDLLARLQLTVRRLGARLRLCDPSAELCQLLAFAGLGEVCGLRVELERQPEKGEDPLGVEEERELDDPTA